MENNIVLSDRLSIKPDNRRIQQSPMSDKSVIDHNIKSVLQKFHKSISTIFKPENIKQHSVPKYLLLQDDRKIVDDYVQTKIIRPNIHSTINTYIKKYATDHNLTYKKIYIKEYEDRSLKTLIHLSTSSEH